MTEAQKQFIIDYINNLYIDVETLDSYSCRRHSQSFDRFREPDDVDWDDEEEWEAKREMCLESIRESAEKEKWGWDGDAGLAIEDFDDDVGNVTLKDAYDFVETL